MKFAPRFYPRNLADGLLCCAVFLVQALGLFVVPAALVYLLTSSSWLALLTPVLVYVIFMLFSVWSVSLSEEGIRFNRILGTPKLLRWKEVLDVSPAPQKELILNGWLWPLLPAREMTACLSSIGHYRIRWESGFCYFPPADEMSFAKCIEEHLNKES
jgi:hypothetical protein